MKNMKKVLIIGGLVVSVLAGGLFAGVKIGASTSWTNEILSSANVTFSQAGFDKKEELKKLSITDEMKSVLNPKIAEEEAELEKMLQEYYDMKIKGLTNTPEFTALEKSIENIKVAIYNRYIKEIDALFVD